MLRCLSRSLIAGFCALALQGGAALAEFAEPDKVAQVLAGERQEAVVSWWGFDPEDSTRFIQAAIDSGAARVVVPKMEEGDWVVRPIHLTQDDQTVFFEQGVVVRAKEGGFRGTRGDRMFDARNRRNIALIGYGATLQMCLEEFERRELRRGGDLIFITGCVGVLIEGLTLRWGWNDGIYIGGTFQADRAYCQDVTIRNVVADANRRQGMSIISVDNLLVENCVFKNTRGASPMAGICIEPNNDRERISNAVIRNSVFLNNYWGMHMWFSNLREESEPVSLLWENNLVKDHFEGRGIGIHVGPVGDDGARGEVVFRNNIVVNTGAAGIHFRNKSSKAMRFVFEDNVLLNTALGGGTTLNAPPRAPVVLHARTERSQAPGGIEFRNLLVASLPGAGGEEEGPVVQVGASSADWGVVWTDVSGGISSTLPNRQGISFHRTQTEDFTLEVNGVPAGTP